MSRSAIISNPAFQRTAPQNPGHGFNLVSETSNFQSVFDIKPLDDKDAAQIDKLLVENFQPGQISEEQPHQDAIHLKHITSEIKAIGLQGVLLVGERVHAAKELLKPYKDGAFTQWLETTFGTRKTGYNYLSYYEFHRLIVSNETKNRLKKMPLRVAYILASREGNLTDKVEIIDKYHDYNHRDLTTIIQEKFPSTVNKHRKRSAIDRLLLQVEHALAELTYRKDELSDGDRDVVDGLRIRMGQLIS